MSNKIAVTKPFCNSTTKNIIPIFLVKSNSYSTWLKKQKRHTISYIKSTNFSGESGQLAIVFDNKTGTHEKIIIGVSNSINIYDIAKAASQLKSEMSESFLKKNIFELKAPNFSSHEINKFCLGWALSQYSFDLYKDKKSIYPTLLWPSKADKNRIITEYESVTLLRDMINTPANDMTPSAIEETCKNVAKTYAAKCTVIKGKPLESGYPLIHTVGKASEDAPRLIKINWGSEKNPKICLVGKGVSFDTGGLNIKPTSYMALMKKDMGGAAHVIALANMIMKMKLPVNLYVFIPAVENAISDNAFRPGDVIKSRNGLTVENTNTDAEGRLILADSLAAASELKPDLIIDCATLTGSARAALGHDIPAFFSNSDKIANVLQKTSFNVNDPLWRMPLWQSYNTLIKSRIADLVNSASTPGDLIYSALFLQKFITQDINWIHVDMFAWENSGKAGRPKGGADTGFRALYSFLEERYGKK